MPENVEGPEAGRLRAFQFVAVDWPVCREKREQRQLAKPLALRIEQDPRRLTLAP